MSWGSVDIWHGQTANTFRCGMGEDRPDGRGLGLSPTRRSKAVVLPILSADPVRINSGLLGDRDDARRRVGVTTQVDGTATSC